MFCTELWMNILWEKSNLGSRSSCLFYLREGAAFSQIKKARGPGVEVEKKEAYNLMGEIYYEFRIYNTSRIYNHSHKWLVLWLCYNTSIISILFYTTSNSSPAQLVQKRKRYRYQKILSLKIEKVKNISYFV